MPTGEPKKLVRGLKDISPLFSHETPKVQPVREIKTPGLFGAYPHPIPDESELPRENQIALLDQYVLVVNCGIKSLTEAYRQLKTMVWLNPRIDVSLVFDGDPEDSHGERLFEGFSQIAERQLGLELNWLGAGHALEKRLFAERIREWEARSPNLTEAELEELVELFCRLVSQS